MTTASDRIADTLADVIARLDRLERAPRLRSASIEGEPLDVFDLDGTLRQTLGLQGDGTYTTTDVNGPIPPTPSGLTVNPGIESISAAWSGSADAALPADFARVAVHVSKVNGFAPTPATEMAAFNTPVGGLAVVPAEAAVVHYVRLVMVSTSETWSAPGPQIAVTPLGALTGTSLRTFSEPPAPGLPLRPLSDPAMSPTNAGDLWFDTDDANHPYRFDGAAWEDIRDGSIGEAAASAGLALDRANAAWSLADQAKGIADGAIRTYYQEDPPWPDGSTQPDEVIGDMWFKTSTAVAYRWDGTDWVVIPDTAISEALATANTAKNTADGKITAYYLPAQPWANGDPAHDGDAGDLWYDTDADAGNRAHYYTGAVWSALPVGLGALGADVTARALGAITTFSGTTDPATIPANGVKDGDLWLHGPQTINGVAGKNILKRRQSGAWVVVDDPKVEQALADAFDAATVADAKVRIFIEPIHATKTAPASDPQPPADLDVDDVWLDSAHGYAQYRWNGAVWAPMLIDSAALAPGATPPDVRPATSPLPSVTGTVGALILHLPPVFNESPVLVDVYMGTASPVPLDATHLHGSGTGSTYTIETLPTGLGGGRLDENATYYLVARARNTAGVDPAAVLPEVTGQARPADLPEAAYSVLYAGTMAVKNLIGDTFKLGEGEVDTVEAIGVNGERVGMSVLENMGFYSFGAPQVAGQQGPVRVWFPVDGKPNIVSGQSQFDDATVNRNLTINGTATVAPGAKIVLGGSVQPPTTQPQAVPSWETVQHTGSGLPDQGYLYAGLTKGHDGNWRSVGYHSTFTSVVDVFAPTGARIAWFTLDPAYTYSGGIVYAAHNGGRYYLLGQDRTSGYWYVEARDTAMALLKRSLIDTLSSTARPALGWDHVTGQLLYARARKVEGAGDVTIYPVAVDAAGNITLGVRWDATPGYAYDYDLGFAARVNTEYGDRYVFRRVAAASGEAFQVFTTAVAPAAPVRQTSEEWPSANSATCRGGWWDGTRFWSLDGSDRRCRYETGRAMWANRTVSATRTSGSAVLTSAGLFTPGDVGAVVTGTGMPAAATVLSYQSANQVTLSAPATSGAPSTGNVTLTVPDSRTVEHAWWAGSRAFSATRDGTARLTSPGLFLPGDVGKAISGTGIAAGTTVLAYVTASEVTLTTSATAGTGTVTITRPTYETTPGPVATLALMPKRARMSVTVPDTPTGAWGVADAIGAAIYVGVGSPVANAAMLREKTIVTPTTTWSLDSLLAAEGGVVPGANPPFPAATPSQLVAGAGVLVNSDGSGSIGTGGLRDSIRKDGEYVGAIKMWPSIVIPPGWLVCDGRPVSRLTYLDLYNLIGTAFGTGDGSLTFNLPDFRGGIPTGALDLLSGQGVGASNLVGIGNADTLAGQQARFDRLAHDHAHGAAGLSTGTVPHGGRNNAPTGGTQSVVGNVDGTQSGTHLHPVTGSTAAAMASTRHGYTMVNFIIKH